MVNKAWNIICEKLRICGSDATIFIVCHQTYYYGDKFKKDEIDGVCSTHGWDEKCIQNLGRKTWKEETNRKS
jgi:hypothetical protein